jgi:hypothetical protein
VSSDDYPRPRKVLDPAEYGIGVAVALRSDAHYRELGTSVAVDV